MPIDTSIATSEGWWLKSQLEALQQRQDRLNKLDRYYRGDPDLPWGPDGCKAAFQRMARKARANWATLIVEAVRERQKLVGFRTGAADDDLGDKEADRIWRANNMPAMSKQVHRAKGSMGDAYTIVGDMDATIGAPLITAEDPRQVITTQDPRDRRRTLSALKVFADDIAQADRAYLYLPGTGNSTRVLTAQRRRTASDAAVDFGIGGWDWGTEQTIAGPIPVIHFPNRADLYGRSMGEFEDVIDDIDRINLMLLQRLVVAVMQAFRQRAVKGDLPERDSDGELIDYADIFRADPGALWQLPAGVDLWESAGVDLTPILESVKADVRDLAATTRTPMFYLFPDAANGSAEGASLMREGLVFKTNDRNDEASDPWERTMALAFLRMNDGARADRSKVQAIWQSPEQFSLSERYDAAVKAKAADVPWRTIMTDVLQFPPLQVDQMEAQRQQDSFLAEPAAPVVTGVSPGG